VEEFDQSLALMARLLGMPEASPRRDNVNPEKIPGRYQVDVMVRREIQSLNEQDADLYADCVRLWRHRSLEKIA